MTHFCLTRFKPGQFAELLKHNRINSTETLKNCGAARQLMAQVPSVFPPRAGTAHWLAASAGGMTLVLLFIVRAAAASRRNRSENSTVK
jgi:hypothetical protein